MGAPKEYWYIGGLSAEETTTTAVHLTKAEHKAVVKFLNQLESRGYSGSCYIDDKAYEDEFKCRSMTDF